MFDSRPTVAWPFSDFRSIFRHICWNVEKICSKSSEESFDLPAILFPWFLRTTSAYASWHMSLSLIVFFPTSRSEFGIFQVSGEGQYKDFRYQIKDIRGEKRIYDFDRKIPTCLFPMRETNSSFLSLATYLILQEWFNPGNSNLISKLRIGGREFLILVGKFQLVDSLSGKLVPHC